MWSLLIVLASFLVAPRTAQAQPLTRHNRQVVLVLTDDWKTTRASLQLCQREAEGWHKQPPVRARIGRKGLAWGGAPGVKECPQRGVPEKREGDGKAPAGVFPLLSCFGWESENPNNGLPYLAVDAGGETWEGVDDVRSLYYNQIVDARKVAKDWESSETMLIPEYRIGVRVGYNTEQPVRGKGSCIFMHLFSVPEKPTSGCTATSLSHMQTLCRWLRSDDHPLLVQLPRPLYQSVRKEWDLP